MYTKDSYIAKANSVHNAKYLYDELIWTGIRTKVVITCKEHGNFEQLAYNHLSGKGCPSCSKVKRVTREDFIKRSTSIHNNLYSYDNVGLERVTFQMGGFSSKKYSNAPKARVVPIV